MEYEPTTAPPGAEITPPAAPPGLGDTAQPPTSTPSSITVTLNTTAPVMSSAAVAVKREPGTGDSGGHNPNQNQAQFDPVKQETVASAHHDIMNHLTQMTSQIASIALEKTAAKTEAVVEDNPESVVEWVTSISRSLQTELQSVYLTLHILALPATAPAPVPTSALTPALLASPSVSPLSLSPSLPSFMPGQHLLVQAETVPTPVLMGSPTPISPSQPLAASTEESGESKKGRRRRKTKTKDSFNHMQRKCASCQRTETTKWRHGPLGSNTLCNTCGLAYSRKKKREAEQAAKLGAAAAAATGSMPSP
ncbi:GATA zinc finger domain containing protein [Acanthamoeba castellanii str. Neff]|uniref:GATA zinc finger domain containing protein n=1 Tax=Acanthamoeba castellanii (strain ATCC 30010 / Neff) TaxID=1257118 RepID=L8GXQ4_ACACF|nr:GATA zinc finger domain containing protein [Acanthamoeba castellanii str. Neff]ELR17722.1 GATA zinc finger domain containing protein [Acanthamoeba castellanii str. Neff]